MAQDSIEVTVARLDERFQGFQSLVSQLADDQRRMAESYEKLVANNQRVALLEAEMVSVKSGQAQLWKKYDAMEEEKKKVNQRWIWEIAKTLLTVSGAVFLYKIFGIHP